MLEALNATLFAQGDIDELEKLWLNIKAADIMAFHFNPFNWLKYSSFYSTKPLENLLDKLVDQHKLWDSGITVYAKVSNTFNNCSEHLELTHKPSAPGVLQFNLLASTAIPVAFPPQGVGLRLVDGGLTDNYGIEEAVRRQADQIITLVCSQPRGYEGGGIKDAFEVLLHLPEWSQLALERQRVREDLAATPDRFIEIIGPKTDFSTLDFNFDGKGSEAINRAGLRVGEEGIRMKKLSDLIKFEMKTGEFIDCEEKYYNPIEFGQFLAPMDLIEQVKELEEIQRIYQGLIDIGGEDLIELNMKAKAYDNMVGRT